MVPLKRLLLAILLAPGRYPAVYVVIEELGSLWRLLVSVLAFLLNHGLDSFAIHVRTGYVD